MSRTNRIGLLLGNFLIGCLIVIWIWTHRVNESTQLWAAWILLVYGCASGFYIWFHGFRCARLIHDIPLSKIGTVAQGYAELYGNACQYEDQKAKTIAGMPILWFRREYAKRDDSGSRSTFPFNLFYTTTNVEESETPLAIKDDTGTACILPYGAEIICARKSVDYQGDTRITERQIMEGDPIYVVGSFSSQTAEFRFQDEYLALVEKWRNDPRQRAKFDINRDGRLDSRELIALHQAVSVEATERESRALSENQSHIIQQPTDDRVFLISTKSPGELAGHYYWWLTIGLVMFFGCGAGAAAMVINRVLT